MTVEETCFTCLSADADVRMLMHKPCVVHREREATAPDDDLARRSTFNKEELGDVESATARAWGEFLRKGHSA